MAGWHRGTNDKRDANEKEIIAPFVAAGWLVKKHGVGYGADFTAYSPRGGRVETCEVKMPGAIRFTESEQELRRELAARGIAYHVLQSVEDALSVINSQD